MQAGEAGTGKARKLGGGGKGAEPWGGQATARVSGSSETSVESGLWVPGAGWRREGKGLG